MTVWGLISDVHGHLPALRRAVARCESRAAERFAFLGDLLGRGDSDGCVALIRSLADLSVLGNRDLDWQARVSPVARAYVLGLPRVAQGDDFLAAHGDARLDRDLCTADLRRGFSRTRARLAATGARVGCFGHSHHARVWRLNSAREPELLYDGAATPAGATLSIASDGSESYFVVNVGTAGLPFPRKGPPSCTVYDSVARTVEILPLA